MEGTAHSPLDRLPGHFPLREESAPERRPSGPIPQACRISDPFAAFPQRRYHLNRMMYARRVEMMMRRAEEQRRRRQRPLERMLRSLREIAAFFGTASATHS